ncbi:hypothetical protein ACQP04_00060 [Pseudonocardia halophobica]|uniref:hypothetical protein n=1 Tax=Pseudonocardia halophobica TaxID=29401 RepID=UPI003D9002F1
MANNPPKPRAEGIIRRRGNSFQAILFAGTDAVTGRQLYLCGSSTDEAEAKKMLRKFIRGAITAAQRWGWIASNPAELARIPRLPAPDPDPPTTSRGRCSRGRRVGGGAGLGHTCVGRDGDGHAAS